MAWLRRIGRNTAPEPAPPETQRPEPVERASPGLKALFDGVPEDRAHAILDLGPAAESSLDVYSRFARWIRFADLIGAADSIAGWQASLKALPANRDRPYDLILAWDVLDRLEPSDRLRLVKRLAELSAPKAKLYAVVGSAGSSTDQAMRFAVLDTDRMVYRPLGSSRPLGPPILPADAERLLEPFHVARAFTSRVGLREYVAVKR